MCGVTLRLTTLLDFDSRAALGAFSAPRLLELAQKQSSRAGVITGRQLGNVFSWMRPDDLVFNYWVSNYLMGDPLPAFDILAWNADSTNLPARLHAEFLDIFKHNTLCQPGAVEVLGTGVDLSRITVPTFVTGAITDHLTPWKGCYRTTELVGGPSTFVLSNAGHIASLVNPPGNPKASYYIGGEAGPARIPGSSRLPSGPGRGGRSGRTGPSSARETRLPPRPRWAAAPIRRWCPRPVGMCVTGRAEPTGYGCGSALSVNPVETRLSLASSARNRREPSVRYGSARPR